MNKNDLSKQTVSELMNIYNIMNSIKKAEMNQDDDNLTLNDEIEQIIYSLKYENILNVVRNNDFNNKGYTISKGQNFDTFWQELNNEIERRKNIKPIKDNKEQINNMDVQYVMMELLIFMKDEIENLGAKSSQVQFDFSESFTQHYFGGHLSEYIPEGEDLMKFKEKINYSNELIKKAINIAQSRELVKKTNYFSRKSEHYNEKYCIFLELTDYGYSLTINFANEINNHKTENELNNKEHPILWLEYNQKQQILLNGLFLIRSCQFNSINDRLLKFLMKEENQNRIINRTELFEVNILRKEIKNSDGLRSQGKETKSFFQFLDDIKIKEILRKLFFPNVSTHSIYFKNFITKDMLKELKIEYIEIKDLIKSLK